MKAVRRQSMVEQTANLVRDGLASGRWAGVMPGTPKLAAECGVSRVTMTRAFKLLEAEGVLSPTLPGKARVFEQVKPKRGGKKKLRVAVLLRQRLKDEDADQQLLYLQLRTDLEQAGHVCVIASRTQAEMNDKPLAVRRLVEKTRADAWIVAGPVTEVAEWFSKQPFPTLLLGGYQPKQNPIACLTWDAQGAYTTALRRLQALGHSRIVMLLPDFHQKTPQSGLVKMIKRELAIDAVELGSYHLPFWEETPEGLQTLLEKLFQVTPPTALLVMRTRWTLGVVSFLGHKGLKVPEDVSLVTTAMDSNQVWHRRHLAYLGTSDEDYLREIERWVEAVSRGREKRERIVVPGFFNEGETVGPPPVVGRGK